MSKFFVSFCFAVFSFCQFVFVFGEPQRFDVVIYGGSGAAVTSAVQVKKMGLSVVIVSPDQHLGGLSSGGLGFTDSGNTATVGGLAREFYQATLLFRFVSTVVDNDHFHKSNRQLPDEVSEVLVLPEDSAFLIRVIIPLFFSNSEPLHPSKKKVMIILFYYISDQVNETVLVRLWENLTESESDYWKKT